MLNIKVLSHELILETVYFEMEITEKSETWIINSRFSELLEIHEKFKKRNKKKGYPKFPPKKFFGKTNPVFLDERQNALDTYFTNIIKYNKKLNYNLKPWLNFFRENKKNEEKISSPEKKNNSNLQLNEKGSLILSDHKDSEILELDPVENLYNEFRKKVIYITNNLVESDKVRDNLFFIEGDYKQAAVKKVEGDDEDFLIDCLDFCSHFDEQFLYDEIETQKLFKNEFVFFFK